MIGDVKRGIGIRLEREKSRFRSVSRRTSLCLLLHYTCDDVPGCIPPSILLAIIAHIGCERTTTTVLLAASIVLSSAIFVGHLCNHNDLAPNYSGILMGITNTPGTIPAFILPALVGAVMEEGVSVFRNN